VLLFEQLNAMSKGVLSCGCGGSATNARIARERRI
jgi:hypothetical protein